MKTQDGLDFDQLKIGFENFIGTMVCLAEDVQDKQDIVALLLESALTISKDENGDRDLHALKPFYRVVVNLLNERIRILSTVQSTSATKQIKEFQLSIKILNDYLKKVD